MCQKLYPKGCYPDGHPQLALSLYNLGSLLQAQGDYAKAEPFLRDALKMYLAQLRRFADLKSEAEALNSLASLPLTRDGFLTDSPPLLPLGPNTMNPSGSRKPSSSASSSAVTLRRRLPQMMRRVSWPLNSAAPANDWHVSPLCPLRTPKPTPSDSANSPWRKKRRNRNWLDA